MGPFYYNEFGEERCKYFERIYIKGGAEEGNVGFWDSCIVCKKEVFVAFELVVGNNLEIRA